MKDSASNFYGSAGMRTPPLLGRTGFAGSDFLTEPADQESRQNTAYNAGQIDENFFCA